MSKEINFNNLPIAVDLILKKVSDLEGIVKDLLQQNKTIDETERFLNIDEVAKLLHLSKATIYTKVSKKELPYIKRGKRLYFLSSDIEAYLKKGKIKTKAEIEAEANSYLLNNKNK